MSYGESAGYGNHDAPAPEDYTPVNSLSPYAGDWTIKVRVTRKDEIRNWDKKNKMGQVEKSGQVASVDLLDAQGGEIRASMFNEEVNKFYTQFEKGKAYLISKGKISMARRKFSNIQHDYQITLQKDSIVQFCADDSGIDMIAYRFTKIRALNDLNVEPSKPKYCDVIGVVHSVDADINELTSQKTQQTYKKRNLVLVDETGSVEVTLWNEDAEKYSEDNLKGVVLALKSCKVSSFNGRTLSAGRDFELNPGTQTATVEALKTWYGDGSAAADVESVTVEGAGRGNSKTSYLSLDAADNLGYKMEKNERGQIKGEYFNSLAQITAIAKGNNPNSDRFPWYMACPVDKCKKKVVPGGGGYTCTDHGNQQSCTPRFIMRFAVEDHTGQTWFTCFHDEAMKILQSGTPGITADQVVSFCREGTNPDEKRYEEIFKAVNFIPWVFNCRARSEMWDNQQRRKCVATRITTVDWVVNSKRLIDKISAAS